MGRVFSGLNSGSGPTMIYDLDINETGRTSTTVTYDVKVYAHLESQTYDFYNAHVTPKISIDGETTVNIGTLGPFPKGVGTKTATISYSVEGITASTSSVSYKFSATQELGGTSSTSTGYVSSKTGTVDVSVYATRPTLSGTVTVKDGSTTLGGYYRESLDAGSLTVSWPAATGSNGTVHYNLERSVNGAAWADATADTTSTSASNAPGATATSVRYRVQAWNALDNTLTSAWIYSTTINQNTMSAPSLTSSATVTYGLTSFTLSLVKATDSMNSTMTYSIAGTANRWTALSGTSTVTPGTITVNLNTADTATTTGTYMTWANMKLAALAGTAASDTNDYKGQIDITVTATNAYGTSKTDAITVVIDLGKDAPVVDTPTITIDNTTTSMYTINSTNYYFPKYKAVKLTLSSNNAVPSATILDKLGRKCSFDISYTSSSVTTFIKNVVAATASTTVNDIDLDMTAASKSVTFTVTAKTYNGVTVLPKVNATSPPASATSAAVTMHYWAAPSLTYKNLVRNATSSTFDVTVTRNTSLSIAIANTTTVKNGATTWGTVANSATYPSTGATHVFTVTSPTLVEADKATITVTGLDPVGSGLAKTATTMNIAIPSFTPALAIRGNGIGVNAVPDGTGALVVGGVVRLVDGSGYFHMGGGALVANDNAANGVTTGTNYDHMWHDDTNNVWHFVSDGTFKKSGTTGDSTIMAKRYETATSLFAGGTASTNILISGGLDLHNSDIINANQIYFADTMTSDTEAIQFPRSLTTGQYYIGTDGKPNVANFDSFRVYNGQGFLNGETIFNSQSNMKNSPLWGGVNGSAAYLTDTQDLPMAKNLTKCANGWVLVWSDFQPQLVPAVASDADFVYTFIHKTAIQGKWHQVVIPISSSTTAYSLATKQIAFDDNSLWGAAMNSNSATANQTNEVVLRWVYEW